MQQENDEDIGPIEFEDGFTVPVEPIKNSTDTAGWYRANIRQLEKAGNFYNAEDTRRLVQSRLYIGNDLPSRRGSILLAWDAARNRYGAKMATRTMEAMGFSFDFNGKGIIATVYDKERGNKYTVKNGQLVVTPLHENKEKKE